MTQVCSEPRMPGVYLIHIENGDHYVGWAEDVDARIDEHESTVCYPPEPGQEEAGWHKTGTGAKFLGVANFRELNWELVRVWWGQDRSFERRVKRWNRSSRFCPVCSGQAAYNRLRG